MRKAAPERVVRPTIRCLLHDLGAEVEPEALAASLRDAENRILDDPRYLFPVALTDARHLVLDKANMLATDASAHREPIRAVADQGVIKVKAGDRRGALWRDPDGTWWLLAAGRRKDDGPGDFYFELGDQFEVIAPTGRDRDYHRFEMAYLDESARELEAHATVLRALLAAAAHPGSLHQVTVFGAEVEIQIDADEHRMVVLTLSFGLTSFEEQDRFPIDLIGFVPGYECIDDWDFLPALGASSQQSWYTFVHQSQVDVWAAAEELEELGPDTTVPSDPVIGTRHEAAHMAPASAVTMGYIEGVEISGLCGVRFTPHRNPDDFTVCPDCDRARALLRLRGPGSAPS